MLRINKKISIPDSEIELHAVRAQGPGGQNVNKVSSAIRLRFDIANSPSLDDAVKARLLRLKDRRITADGIVNIKAQRSRSQDKNRIDAVKRLSNLLKKGLIKPKPRKKTKPPKKAKEKRLADKAHRAKVKRSRGSVAD